MLLKTFVTFVTYVPENFIQNFPPAVSVHFVNWMVSWSPWPMYTEYLSCGVCFSRLELQYVFVNCLVVSSRRCSHKDRFVWTAVKCRYWMVIVTFNEWLQRWWKSWSNLPWYVNLHRECVKDLILTLNLTSKCSVTVDSFQILDQGNLRSIYVHEMH